MQIQCHRAKICVHAPSAIFPKNAANSILQKLPHFASQVQNAKHNANCKIPPANFLWEFKKICGIIIGTILARVFIRHEEMFSVNDS
jgi:hypothetical protein